MGHVSEYTGRIGRVTVRQATAHGVERNGGSAVRRSDAGHSGTSRPMQRDNRNPDPAKGVEK